MATIVAAILAALHPWAAAGAAFGCVFYLMMPAAITGWRRAGLAAVSWGVGYGAGVFWYGGGPPYLEKAMLVSAITSSLAVVVLTAAYGMSERGGPLPQWAGDILDRIPFTKNKGSGDGL